MSRERIYSARPINTYTGVGADVGNAYVAFLKEQFLDCAIVDPGEPNGEISRRAKELKEQEMINPATGQMDEKYYNENGSNRVMAYFTNEVIKPCTIGCGLMLPIRYGSRGRWAIGAGVAAELTKMHDLGRPVWLIACESYDGTSYKFRSERVTRIVTAGIIDSVSKQPLCVFNADYGSYDALSVNETRARMYTPRPDGTWDRENLQPYFLE